MMRNALLLLLATGLLVTTGCDATPPSPLPVMEDGAAGLPGDGDLAGSPGAPDLAMSLPDQGRPPGDMSVPAPSTLCNMAPPAGAKLPPPPPRYNGTCPMIKAGMNTIRSGNANRQFLVAEPANLQPGEKLPLVFMWHWLGGSADSFYRKGDVQKAVDTQRFIAVFPISKGDLLFKWPFEITVLNFRVEEELRYFDDMLACVTQQYNINTSCVSSVGVSAGALWTDQLISTRGQYLSSAVSLSGGTGSVARAFGNPQKRMPMIVLWGGPTDTCIGLVNFQTMSKDLENHLKQRGHFFLECIHNCSHAEPPFDAPAGLSKYAGLWAFMFDHPYWLPDGESPYKAQGLPSTLPPWCGIGQGSAKPRTGMCDSKPGC